MSVEILDNFLNTKNFDEIKENILNRNDFPWFLSNGINNPTDKDQQFYHLFYENFQITSNYFKLLIPILKSLKVNSLVKLKINLMPRSSEIIEYKWHRDVPFVCKTGIFYFNSNNGYTLFKDLPNVESISNRLVIFDSNLNHGGTSCTDANFRCVLNINYF